MAELPTITSAVAGKANLRFRGQVKPRRPGPITALDVEGQTLFLAQTNVRGGRAAISRIEVSQLELNRKEDAVESAELGQAIAESLADLRLKPAQVVMGVPRHSVVLRTLTVPYIEDLRELASIIHLQVAKDLPFRPEDAVIDFKVRQLSRNPAGPAGDGQAAQGSEAPAKLDVLVAAVRRETVSLYEKVAAAAKLKLVALGWLSQANARCLEACQLTSGEGATALISLRAEAVGIDIIAAGSLMFSRGATLPSTAEPERPDQSSADGAEPMAKETERGTLDAKQSFADAVTIEAVRTLHSYGGTDGNVPVSRLVVAGMTGEERVVVDALQQRLSIPCTVLEPGAVMELPDAGRHHAGGAIGAMGLALGLNDPEGLPFNFLNPKRPAVQRDTRRLRMLGLAAAGAALLIAVLAVRTHFVRQREKVRVQLQAEVTDAEKKLPTYRRMQQQAANVQLWSREGRDWLDQYAYLSAVLPGSEELYITAFSVSGQGNIHLAVQARSGEVLGKLDRQLRDAGYDVKPLAINPGNEKHGYNFRSTVELIVPAKMKIDLGKAQPPARPDDDASLDPRSRTTRRGGRS
ncbi:MAG: pilus assembly protein PilM [Verrucomicrobiota bacterium]